MKSTLASIITIGDELLIGQIIDTNSAWIAQELNKLGITMHRRIAVGDEWNAIWNTLTEELKSSDIVIITGGLGPTADDITKPLLAKYFGGAMRRDERVLEHVTNMFARRNKPMLESNRMQADVPDTCKVLFNTRGTAPGMWFQQNGKVTISLPGVPGEMKGIMQDEALPLLQELYAGGAIVHTTIVTAGEGESYIAESIKDIEQSLPPHIKLAYLPGAWIVKLRLSGYGTDENNLRKEVYEFKQKLLNRVQHIAVAVEDMPLEQVIKNTFTEKNITLALAESCTGGNIAHLATQIPGSSAYFKGSIVCYHPSVKTNILNVPQATLAEHGIVSEATATAMAMGARQAIGADIGFGITGTLGPTIEEERTPIGTVWMAVTNGTHTETRCYQFHYDRLRNKDVAVSMAMLLIYRFAQGMSS